MMFFLSMKTTLSKWGNSVAIRIPRPFALEAGMMLGNMVDISLRRDSIVITKSKPKLDDIMKKITPKNVHSETHFGKPVGREIW